MPIYLAHGFRWPRDGMTGIRTHTIVHNLDGVSTEYIQNASSRTSLLANLRQLHPSLMQPLESSGRALDFLEQYDPLDVGYGNMYQPYAFVCDWVVMIAGGLHAEHYANALLQSEVRPPSPVVERGKKERKKTLPLEPTKAFNSPATIANLSVNMEEVMADSPALSTEAWTALAELRDKLADGEKIGWWVVYNGDPDRYYPATDEEEEEDEGEEQSVQDDRSTLRSATESTPSLVTSRTESMKGPGRVPPPMAPIGARSPTNTSKPLPMHPREKERDPKSPSLRKKIFGKKT
jgi:hypothetical protein